MTGRCRAAVGAMVVAARAPGRRARPRPSRSTWASRRSRARRSRSSAWTSTPSSRTASRSTRATRSSSCRSASTRSTSRRAAATMLPLISPDGRQGVRRQRRRRVAVLVQRPGPGRLHPRARCRPGTFGKKLSYNGSKRRRSAACRSGREAQAGHRDVQEDRQVHVLLQHPRRHEGHGHRQGQGQDGAVRQGRQEGRRAPGGDARSSTSKKLPQDAGRRPTRSTSAPPASTARSCSRSCPGAVTIPTGTTLNFRMHPARIDVHTATTGPGNPETEPNSYLGQIAASFNSRRCSTRGPCTPARRPAPAGR